MGIELDNWKFNPPNICMYEPDSGVSDLIAMHYHTDYRQAAASAPGDKFAITCTMYLNDNYDGGEILFKIYANGKDEPPLYISYKPKAGDIVIFPSGEPYYHAVNLVKNGEKYFVRSFWQYEFYGTPEWQENEKKFGKKVWSEIEEEREWFWRRRYRAYGLYEQKLTNLVARQRLDDKKNSHLPIESFIKK